MSEAMALLSDPRLKSGRMSLVSIRLDRAGQSKSLAVEYHKFTGPVPFLVELFDLAELSVANPCKSFAWKRATRTQKCASFCGSTQKTRTDHEKLKFAKFAKSKGSQLAWNLSGKIIFGIVVP